MHTARLCVAVWQELARRMQCAAQAHSGACCTTLASLPSAAPSPVVRKQAYARLRRQEGVSEMGDLVLGLATELMASFDFMPT